MTPRCEIIFLQSIRSEQTKKTYRLQLDKFRKFVNVDTLDQLLQGDQNAIQEKIEDYIIYQKGKISPNSFPTQMAPIFLFYELNDVVLNKTKLKKMYPAKIKVQGKGAYTREDIWFLLSNTNKKRSKAVILILASTGCRISGLCGLKIDDLLDAPRDDCKCIRFYSGDPEEYYGFLTPEATSALYEYLQERIAQGEKLSPDKPLITMYENFHRRLYSPDNVRPITKSSVTDIIRNVFAYHQKSRKVDVGGRYTIPTTHGFRKYFNKTLKLRDGCNISICERLMGHSVTVSLDNSYLPLGPEDLFCEFEKAIPDLTIRDDERNKLKLYALQEEKKKEEGKERENQLLKEELEILRLRIQRMELSKDMV